MSDVPRVPSGKSTFGMRIKRALLKSKGKAEEAAAASDTTPAPDVPTVPDGKDSYVLRLTKQMDKFAPPKSEEGEQPAAEEEEKAAETGPVGTGDYLVKHGDCISSIARNTGHFWETIWNDPANSELKQVRENPNVLLPQDRVTIPELRCKDKTIAPEKRHRFVRRGEPAKLHIQILKYDKPRANQPYEFDVDGTVYSGKTDGNGNIVLPIPGNARQGKLLVGPSDDQAEYAIALGDLAPITELIGVQARLNNLGFDCGAADGRMNPETEDALRRFQQSHGLRETGKPDQDTRDKLLETHGS